MALTHTHTHTHTHTCTGDTAAFTVSVSSGSSIGETCGLCGTQEGQLQFRDGTFADITDRVEVEAFTMSYLVPARDQALRPQRRECGELGEDVNKLKVCVCVRCEYTCEKGEGCETLHLTLFFCG